MYIYKYMYIYICMCIYNILHIIYIHIYNLDESKLYKYYSQATRHVSCTD